MKTTKRQMDFIKIIESYIYPYYHYDDTVLFKGETKKDAQKWISDNIENFKRIQAEVDALNMIQQEEYSLF